MSTRSVRKTKTPARPYEEFRDSSVPPSLSTRPRKRARGPRVQLTHLEVRGGETLLLRIAIANDALAEVGAELGALIKKIAPSTRTSIAVPTPEVARAQHSTHARHADQHAAPRSRD